MRLLEQNSFYTFFNYFALIARSNYFKEHLSATISKMMPSSKSQFLIEIVILEMVHVERVLEQECLISYNIVQFITKS